MRTLITTLLIAISLIVVSQNTVSIKCSFTSDVTANEITFENYINPAALSKTIPIKNNSFSIDLPIGNDDIYKLKFTDDNFLAMIISPNEKITMSLNPTLLSMNPKIEGSPATNAIYKIQTRVNNFESDLDSLGRAYRIASSEIQKSDIETKYSNINASLNTYLTESILANKETFIPMFFIDKLKIDEYFQVYSELESSLSAKYPNHPVVINLSNKVKSAQGVFVGTVSPDIAMKTPEDKEINLHGIKGAKVIIIDFWASWCKPCRMENPNMTKLYADYHDKGLEIFGVSLDKDLASWKKAIASDKLTWLHVSDLKGWNNAAARLYGVSSIPAMFVIDGQTYKILAKNLRGDSLRQFISKQLD